MILDTSFVIDVLRGDAAAADWEAELDAKGTAVVTSITVMELWEGIHRVDASAAERTRVRDFLDGITHAPFDHDAAMRAGELGASLDLAGTPIDVGAVMIAAIALVRSEPVLTGNPSPFQRIDGLRIETY